VPVFFLFARVVGNFYFDQAYSQEGSTGQRHYRLQDRQRPPLISVHRQVTEIAYYKHIIHMYKGEQKHAFI